MYSKEDAKRIKKEFWIQFAETYPRKWLLHNTKIKDVSFKFYADNKKAEVLLDIEPRDEEKRKIYYEKVESLKGILLEDHLPDALFEREYYLENGKLISRIWVSLEGVSINNPKTWDQMFDFFNEKMTAFEIFFYEYEDYIRDLEINT
ncbi:DUF4268 domain-containing protein [Myroides sp. WP-1]|uniref:DUF4268 domain-containing protein n=1 Tax=Myroides sp. WP-1 TaxID=2759944 RepID=UPI0015F9BD82|nr:DUF4268 domain-containing protein [Myroides sp. WP-1]MBB1139983.1 DUF4268 domain-containing protein [Myroides sp. WP-1]